MMMQNNSNPNDSIASVLGQAIKSPSVLTFGGTLNNNSTVNNTNQSTSRQSSYIPELINPLQDLTLNKQGQIPQSKDSKLLPKINPKDLSNEELEYIIRTGKLPPRIMGNDANQSMVTQQQQQQNQYAQLQNLQNSIIQPLQSSVNYQHQQNQQNMQNQMGFNQNSSSKSINLASSDMLKTQNQLNQLNNYLVGNSTVNYDKENLVITDRNSFQQKQGSSYDDNVSHLKNYNSPRIINEINPFTQSSSYHQAKQQNLLTAQVQPIALQQNQNSFINLDNSTYSKTLELSQQFTLPPQTQSTPVNNALNQSTSNAATQAMKALSDKVKSLENQNQLLQDQLQIVENQSKESNFRLQQKLKEECDKSQNRESQLREEVQIMKRQLESTEQEKQRHLEENSAEREQWRQQYKRTEEENINLKKQLQEHIDKYSGIEETIKDIKRREQQIRDRYEREVDSEKERGAQIQQDVEEAKARYEQLKGKLREKNKQLEQENNQLREEIDQVISDKDRQIQLLQREAEKWKRECLMLKEEMSILGDRRSSARDQQPKTTKKKQSVSKTGSEAINTVSSIHQNGITPKSNQVLKSNHRKSPFKNSLDEKALTQTLNINQTMENQNFQTVDNQAAASQPQTTKKTKKSQSKLSKQNKARNGSNAPSIINNNNQQENPNKSSHHGGSSVQRNQGSALKQRPSSQDRKSSSASRQLSGSKLKKSRLVSTKERNPGRSPSIKSNKERTLNGAQSHSNLISINTKKGRAENVLEDNINLSVDIKQQHNSQEYIFVDNHTQRSNSNQRQPYFENNLARNANLFKRSSIESNASLPQYGLSSVNSEYGAMIYSHQSSVDHQSLKCQDLTNSIGNNIQQVNQRNSNPLNINEFNSSSMNTYKSKESKNGDRFSVDNEIFYLEREIFDFNQQYKTLLSQQSQSSISFSANLQPESSQNLNIQLRQIAQMLEEKSERLFELKKQQQQMLLSETYRDKNPFQDTGIKTYMYKQNI
ncbi:UNKNOWN [Stylonychia lemnae]|uniref:Uncharacterized protein n=1 Tax=Stylonychia lemnae TaxID=5949 RepID=A0A077ZZX6_STYLE|nr:UNKNOWN [Stylonychia lemnae]|eukprot:CDW74073.1 UNKNOWN [Stylonychia lemnae]